MCQKVVHLLKCCGLSVENGKTGMGRLFFHALLLKQYGFVNQLFMFYFSFLETQSFLRFTAAVPCLFIWPTVEHHGCFQQWSIRKTRIQGVE